MVLDYSGLEFDSFGRPEVPELMLQTLGGDTIGLLTGVSNLKLHVKFSEPSEITFDISKEAIDFDNDIYDAVTGYKVIYTKQYGIYMILNPATVSDGIAEVKQVKGYSLEKALDSKKFFIEEGTFNFWNPTTTENTILGRILEIATDWSVGYVDSTLIGRYRTFDSCDDYLMSFVYNTVPEKFRCIFVFDPYKMTISVYDADEERPSIPVYLDFDNLIEEVTVDEISDEMITAISPYGADDLDVRMVNPIGTNWVYDLSYFIANGDISGSLAERWTAWQRSVLTNQSYYNGLIGLRASSTAQLFTLEAALTDLNGELDNLVIQQGITIQQVALETTTAGIASQEALLASINSEITVKKSEITAKEKEIASVEEDLDSDDPNSYNGQIQAVVNELSFTKYFTTAEQMALSRYFIEQTVTESTFVATDVTSALTGDTYQLTSGSVVFSGAVIYEIDFVQDFGKRMFTVEGGTFSVSGGTAISGDVIRGTVEISNSGSYVTSLYLGTVAAAGTTYDSGVLTLTGSSSSVTDDVTTQTEDGLELDIGSWLKFNVSSTNMYLTTSVTDYQKYAVQMELFDFAVAALDDLSSPTYEFSIDSGNVIFAQEFAPFREYLELGKCVYLSLGNETVITPIMIEYELDFEDLSKFSIIFSNRFKRHDEVNTLKDMIETSYSTSKSFDASQYIYSQSVGQTSAVSEFISNSLDAAKNTILAASNQSVVINGAGIQVGGDSNYQLRIIDSMIAMTDDSWNSAKLAIGRFASAEVGEYWGINAEVIGGKLIAGNNLIIESEKADGDIASFRVDGEGVSLHNATFDIYNGYGSRQITLNPDVGFAIGTYPVYSSTNTINKDNASFWVDIDGNVYMKGTLEGCDGTFSGELQAATGTFSGELQAATGTFSGSISAASGTFTGTIKASDYLDKNGNSMLVNSSTDSGYQFDSDYLSLLGIDVGNGNFTVDQYGNVAIKGSITMSAGSTINWASVTETNMTSSTAYTTATGAQTTANSATTAAANAQTTANSATTAAANAAADAAAAAKIAENIANGKYSNGTFISGTEIYSPTIYSNEFKVIPESTGSDTNTFSLYGYYATNTTLYELLRISYNGGSIGYNPSVKFTSPASGDAYFDFANMYFNYSRRTSYSRFYGYVDFSNATVTGLNISTTATFG